MSETSSILSSEVIPEAEEIAEETKETVIEKWLYSLSRENKNGDFIQWVGSYFAESSSPSGIATILAMQEIADQVFNIGGGFRKVTTSSMSLSQIIETVLKIKSQKADNSIEPLNDAVDCFHKAIQSISNGSYQEAYQCFNDVITNASTALQSFQESTKAFQLIIFSEISRFSYDTKIDTFLPFSALPIEKKKLIGNYMEDLIRKSVTERKNANTSMFSFGKTKKAFSDQVLKIGYQFVSEANGWTDMRKIYSETMNIAVAPQFLPWGVENAAKVIVGVNALEEKVNTIHLWRTQSFAYSMNGSVATKATIDISDDNATMSVDVLIDNCPKVTMSNLGPSVPFSNHDQLGQYYKCDQDGHIYKLSSTDYNKTQRYTAIYTRIERIKHFI